MYKKVLKKIGCGLYIISSELNGKYNGQIANSVLHVNSQPFYIAVSMEKKNLTHDFVKNRKIFSVSVLSQSAPLKFIGLFGFNSGADIDKFENIKYKLGQNGTPIVVENCAAFMEAKVVNSIDAGAHTLFMGELTNAGVISDDEPMSYSYYHLLKQGKASPVAAPSVQTNSVKYECEVCKYIYDPNSGDPENGVKPGTEFEKLPENWKCPICSMGKDKFRIQT